MNPMMNNMAGRSSMLNSSPTQGEFTPYQQSFAQIGSGPRISSMYSGPSGIVPTSIILGGINPPAAAPVAPTPTPPGTDPVTGINPNIPNPPISAP